MKKIFFLSSLCMLTIVLVKAQTDVYNTGQLYLSNSSDTVYISGSLNNTNTSSLNNTGGNLYILQHLNNDEANMAAGAGKLWFSGSSVQNITGSQQVRTYNWVVNNVAGVNVQNRIGIGNGTSGTLSFENGLINSGTNLQDVYFYPNSTYTGYTDNTHIIGYCTKSGATNFTYPVGNGTLKADFDIVNLSASADFQCKYFGTGYGNYTPLAPLISVFENEYWVLDRTVGTASAQIMLKWNDARNMLNHLIPSDLRVGHFSGGNWISEGGVGSGNTAIGTITSGSISNFSPFTFASVGSILPLKITNYAVTVNSNCGVNISWQSFDETDVARYIIQKSKDGSSWQNVATVYTSATTTTASSHYYTDNSSTNGSWIYRVKVETSSSNSFYTESKLAKLNCNISNLSVYPTVTNDVVNITCNNSPLKTIVIFNQYGQLMHKQDGGAVGATKINFSGYPAGEYNISITTSVETKIFKIIKVN